MKKIRIRKEKLDSFGTTFTFVIMYLAALCVSVVEGYLGLVLALGAFSIVIEHYYVKSKKE